MRDNIDINAGTVMDGTVSIQTIGKQIFEEVIHTASGKLTRAEVLGHVEFALPALMPTL
jgi:altronate dehydratase large subunit